MPSPRRTAEVHGSGLPISDGDQFVVVAPGIPSPHGPLVVLVVARSLKTVQESTSVVTGLWSLGYPMMLLVVALTSY